MNTHKRRDLRDRSQPNDLNKSADLKQQAIQGERPETPEGAGPAVVQKRASQDDRGVSALRRQGLDPQRDRSPSRPRDEGGLTPSR